VWCCLPKQLILCMMSAKMVTVLHTQVFLKSTQLAWFLRGWSGMALPCILQTLISIQHQCTSLSTGLPIGYLRGCGCLTATRAEHLTCLYGRCGFHRGCAFHPGVLHALSFMHYIVLKLLLSSRQNFLFSAIDYSNENSHCT
jgi:hypothetical protein